jgi:hypothetical protein
MPWSKNFRPALAVLGLDGPAAAKQPDTVSSDKSINS